jgi:hypothetical protein
MEVIIKAKAAMQGETHVWKDGRAWKKLGVKWVLASNVQRAVSKKVETSETLYNHSLATTLGNEVSSVLEQHGIHDFPSLVEKIKSGPPDTAHKIYHQMFDDINKGPGTVQDKQAALHLIGTSIVKIRDQFLNAPKVTSTIKVKSHITGKEYYRKEKVSKQLPVLKPTEILSSQKKMGGWSVTGILETSHVKEMIKNKTAKLVSGKIDSKKKWIMPKKAEDMELRYTGDSLTIHVKQIRMVDQRSRATAKVDIDIPYTYAKAFFLNHIESVKTRNNFIFRLEHSKGYRAFLERAESK